MSLKKRVFVAGTDTGVGKTLVSAAILEAAKSKGLKALGLKPVAAGAELVDEILCNEDALLLQDASSTPLGYEQHNPLCLREPMAPHIAAEREGRKVSASRLAGQCRGAIESSTDLVLIEGAGGWRVPLNPRESMATLAAELGYPVILVVGMKLGCLNHALLTAEAMQRDGVKMAGWVANTVEADMPVLRENIETLQALLPAPLLAEIPYSPGSGAKALAEQIDINDLFKLLEA